MTFQLWLYTADGVCIPLSTHHSIIFDHRLLPFMPQLQQYLWLISLFHLDLFDPFSFSIMHFRRDKSGCFVHNHFLILWSRYFLIWREIDVLKFFVLHLLFEISKCHSNRMCHYLNRVSFFLLNTFFPVETRLFDPMLLTNDEKTSKH